HVLALDKSIEAQLIKERDHRRRLPPNRKHETELIGATQLLRVRRERPRRRRAAEQRDELAALDLRAHSITSSAATCSVGGTVRPSGWVVLRFITNSNLVGCKTGKSAGFSPLRIRPV